MFSEPFLQPVGLLLDNELEKPLTAMHPTFVNFLKMMLLLDTVLSSFTGGATETQRCR